MKKVVALVLSLIISFSCFLVYGESATNQGNIIIDKADILNETQEQELLKLIEEVYTTFNTHLMLYLIEDGLSMNDLRVAAADEYEAQGFGADGIILALDTSSRKYYYITAGMAMTIFGDYQFDILDENVLPYLKTNDFPSGCYAFVDTCNTILSDVFTDKAVSIQDIDISTLSYQELVELQTKIQYAIWNSQEWQEVTVPAGLYQVGVEIPAGNWTITALPKGYGLVTIGTKLRENGLSIASTGSQSNFLYGKENWVYNESKMTSWSVTLTDGLYIELEEAEVFTPYEGPSFSFK